MQGTGAMKPPPSEAVLREGLVGAMRAMDAKGLNHGTAGNASVRLGDGMLVTPTGVPAARLTPDQIVRMEAGGATAPDALKPSSEWRIHLGILRRRGDIDAIVHCHSRYATILACAHRPIPPLHYMVAVGGGASIPLAPYATFGSETLAEAVVDTLDGINAALMANHGQIAVARGIEHALAIAEEVEEQAALYWGTLAIGGPRLLDDGEMDNILSEFSRYGQKR